MLKRKPQGWSLRPARIDDRDFPFELNQLTMRAHVERVWGWDDALQAAFFDDRFLPERWHVIQAEGQDIGVLIVEDNEAEIYLTEIQLLPELQGQGIGTAIIHSLIDEAVASGKPLTLRVLP